MSENLGIHQIRNNAYSSSFFIQRAFGNYIIYADYMQEIHFEVLKSKGGVSRIFLEDSRSINSSHGEMFNRFGCCAVLPKGASGAAGDQGIPVEVRGESFHDHTLRWTTVGGASCLCLKQRDQKIAIFGNSARFQKRGSVLFGDSEITDQVLEYCHQNAVSVALFSRHEGEAFWRPVSKMKRWLWF